MSEGRAMGHAEGPAWTCGARARRDPDDPGHRRLHAGDRGPRDQEGARPPRQDGRQPLLRALHAHADLVRDRGQVALRRRDQLLGGRPPAPPRARAPRHRQEHRGHEPGRGRGPPRGVGRGRTARAGAPCSIVNAGDGAHEHPTQALLDLLTIREKQGHLEGLHVAIVGDIAHSRVARSNIHGMRKLGMTVTVAGPPTLIPPVVAGAGRQGRAPAGGRHPRRRRDHDAAPAARAHGGPASSRRSASTRASGGSRSTSSGQRAARRADHASGPGEPRRRAVARGRRRAVLGDPRPGGERRGGAHGVLYLLLGAGSGEA